MSRLPRTQVAVSDALTVADAALLVDNSRTSDEAFTLCRIQLGTRLLFDLRDDGDAVPPVIRVWLDRVALVSYVGAPLQKARPKRGAAGRPAIMACHRKAPAIGEWCAGWAGCGDGGVEGSLDGTGDLHASAAVRCLHTVKAV